MAVPHAYVEGLSDQIVVFVRLKNALNMSAPDGTLTRFLFVLLGSPGQAAEHLDTLTAIARLMSDDTFRFDAGEATSGDDLSRALDEFEARTELPARPATEEVSSGLQYTGRWAGGLRADFQRRLAQYPSDFLDGLHPKTIGSTLFLYFACLAPAITFGGLMYLATGGTDGNVEAIGPAEMLVAVALGGIVFSLFGGQPLLVLGGTGPLLVLTGVIYLLCRRLGYAEHFLEIYAWIGLWSAAYCILLAVTDASCLIRWFTRFTDEIFTVLIASIFIAEAGHQIVNYVRDAHAAELQHDVAFLSLILALGTFTVAMILSRFRHSCYLRPMAREFLADLGPTIAVAIMIVFAFTFPQVRLERLAVPDRLGTTTGRPWLVDLFSVPRWIWLGAALPALFVALLMYVNQNIVTRIVSSPDNRLKKGDAYHLNLLVVGILQGVCSLFGLPWLVAATVRSLNHLRSLATFEESWDPQGGSRQRILHVREQRVTGLLIHLLIALSLLLLPVFRQVPQAVLYGLFLYMGVVSLAGNQFFERIMLWVMDPALYPRTHYIRQVPVRTIHLFTLLQMACLIVLWVVKVSPVGILFPLFVALLVPVRLWAGRYFRDEVLVALDADELPKEERTEWV